MNKAYLLVICVLAASFTGCLSDDTSNLEEQQNTEDETIEPVGTHNNETHDYDILVGEIQNLTDEIEELRLEIEELQASEYQPPENSSFTTNTYVKRYDENNTPYDLATPQYRFSKQGHTLIIEYVGPMTQSDYYVSDSTELFCTSNSMDLTVYNADGVPIDTTYSLNAMKDANYNFEMLCEKNPQIDDNDFDKNTFYGHWSRITKTFSEEPARIGFSSAYSGQIITFQ